MDLIIIIIRTMFFYIFTIFIFRIMGKKEVGQLCIQDLVVSILIAELCAISIENFNDSILYTIIPIVILLLFELSSAYLSLKLNKFRTIINGKPSLIINKGKINYKEMIKQRYSLDDLLLELRNNKIKDINDVEYAVLENTGRLNIFKYNHLNHKNIYPFPLILDGIIQEESLKYIKKDETWLNEYLENNDVKVEDIFYAFYKNNRVYVIRKNELCDF